MKKSWWNSAPAFPSPVGAGRFPSDARKYFGESRREREGKKGNEFPPNFSIQAWMLREVFQADFSAKSPPKRLQTQNSQRFLQKTAFHWHLRTHKVHTGLDKHESRWKHKHRPDIPIPATFPGAIFPFSPPKRPRVSQEPSRIRLFLRVLRLPWE